MPAPALRRFRYLFLALTAVLLLAPGIWEPTGLTGKDEFFLGLRTPMEMMARDQWLVPFLDEAPRIRKPPLLYWLGRAGFELFGASLETARGIAVAFAALLAVATAGIGRRLTGDVRTGMIAGVVLLTLLGLHTEGRRFMLDVPVAALSAAAFWALLAWLDPGTAPGRRWPWLTLATALLAAGFLVKGPIVALVCGGGLLAFVFAGRLTPSILLRGWPALAGHAGLWAALALPWFFAVRGLYPEAAQKVLADEIESRQFFDLSPGIVLGLVNVALPWVFVFAAAAAAQWRAIAWERGLPRLLFAWFLLTFLPFLFIKSFDRYLIGSLVPLSVFVAMALPQALAGPRWPFRAGLAVALLLGGGLAGFAAWFGLGGWPWLLPAAAYFAWAWWQRRPLAHTLAAPALYWMTLLWCVFPALGVNGVPPAVADIGRSRPVAFFDGPQPALLAIMSGRAHRHYAVIDAEAAARLAQAGTPVFLEARELPRLDEQLAAAGHAAEPAGRYAVLASHGSGLRFAKPGATGADWREAFATRRLDPLMTEVVWVTLRPLEQLAP